MRFKHILLAALLPLSFVVSAYGQDAGKGDLLEEAAALYRAGMYSHARVLFLKAGGAKAEAYSVLSSIMMRSYGFREEAAGYLAANPESIYQTRVRYALAMASFDDQEYARALEEMDLIEEKYLQKDQLPSFLYKKGYAAFSEGDYDTAEAAFHRIEAMPMGDYTAPAKYNLGYISYSEGNFREASSYFAEAMKDPRFTQTAAYYILECRFLEKDYQYVVDHVDYYEKVPEDRQPHLARIISESYLVLGDSGKAKEYYVKNLQNKTFKTRSDYFYAGSVLYAVKDWQGAVDNFLQMTSRSDSLGQVASYEMGCSYIELKNKVAAMDAFKDAADLDYDPELQEDALYNYAKLSFDLNSDPAAFNDYVSRYGTLAKGDQIYGYMALSCLYKHDYEGAVAAYDKIDVLDEGMKGNYRKAYFLRAKQQIDAGSYREAVPNLKAAAYYSSRHDPFNQLSRYWIAECYFRDGKYQDAKATLIDLYNIAALDGKPEGRRISYNIAWCYFKEGDYPNALKWFENSLAVPHDEYGADALMRMGDCHFYRKDYRRAIASYGRKQAEYADPQDLYPVWRAGIAAGLMQDHKTKVDILEDALQASPTAAWYSESMYELSRAYIATGDDEDAVRTLKTLRNTTSDADFAARSAIDLGMIERNRGNNDQALSYYKSVVSAMPGTEYSENALLAIESIYRTKQEPEAYIAYVESLSGGGGKTETDKESMYYSTAEQVFLSGSWEKALSMFSGYLERYPSGTHAAKAMFYTAECHRKAERRPEALDWYSRAIDTGLEGSFAEQAMGSFASISYELGHYGDAYKAWSRLEESAGMDETVAAARLGKMRSAYRGRDYSAAIPAAEAVRAASATRDDLSREADFIKAKSLLMTGRRAEALEGLKELSREPSTDEGAEAKYLVIKNLYDTGDFAAIPSMVYEFSSGALGQNYWLAKAYIVLGDSFAEEGNFRQARETFESILSGYSPCSESDDVPDQVRLRLSKLENLQ
ncbi:MAG: tetratricopeptide repeat protein [Bacteroidales bacterium]|nr:tetratricopeptide repeat protein [Bacteroidales bacterium]